MANSVDFDLRTKYTQNYLQNPNNLDTWKIAVIVLKFYECVLP